MIWRREEKREHEKKVKRTSTHPAPPPHLHHLHNKPYLPLRRLPMKLHNLRNPHLHLKPLKLPHPVLPILTNIPLPPLALILRKDGPNIRRRPRL